VIDTRVFRKAMHDIAARKGDFTLFALFLRADALGAWDLVVSAPWLGSEKLKRFRELVDLLAKSAGRRSLQQLARVEPVAGDDPTVEFLLTSVPVEDGERHLQNTELFGLQIEKAIILRAQRPDRKKRVAKALRSVGAGLSRGRDRHTAPASRPR